MEKIGATMSEIKLRWKNHLTTESDYYRSCREGLERAINVAAGFYSPGALASGIRGASGGPMASAWREIFLREGLEIMQEETVRFEELLDGDLVRFPVAVGFEYHTVHRTEVWIGPETGDPRKVPISGFERIEVWRDGKWLQVVK